MLNRFVVDRLPASGTSPRTRGRGALLLGLGLCGACSRSLGSEAVGSVLDDAAFWCVTADLGVVPSAIVAGTTDGEGNFGASTCGGDRAPESAYLWESPADGTFRVSVSGQGFDPILQLRPGSCDNEEVACAVSSGAANVAVIDIVAERGAVVVLVVDGVRPNAVGEFTLSVERIE